MPQIDELFQSAKATLYISTIVLQSGYWQVVLEESGRNKTVPLHSLALIGLIVYHLALRTLQQRLCGL